MKPQRSLEFLNVDLEIESSTPLGPLEQELSKSSILLYSGPGPKRHHLLCLESNRWPKNPDQAISLLCDAIEKLSMRGRYCWDRANRKQFDIGYEMTRGTSIIRTVLRPESVARVAGLGATLAFTCYRFAKENSQKTKKALATSKVESTTKPGKSGKLRKAKKATAP